MNSSGQEPSPQPWAGGSRRHGRGADERRRAVGSQWSLLAAASRRSDSATAPAVSRRAARLPWAASHSAASHTTDPRPERAPRDDPGADFVLRAMQRFFQ